MRIVIIGGGYAGQSAVKSILKGFPEGTFDRKKSVRRDEYIREIHEIVLLDKNPYATVMPLLPDLAAAKVLPSSVKGDFKKILPPQVRFLQCEVEEIDAENRKVFLKSDTGSQRDHLVYDVIVIASGSRAYRKPFNRFKGRYFCVDSLPETLELGEAVKKRIEYGKLFDILIIGAGYTACEVAANLEYACHGAKVDSNKSLGRIHILSRSGNVLKNISKERKEPILDYFRKRSIQVHSEAELDSWDGKQATVNKGQKFIDPIVVVSTGMTSSMEYTGSRPVHAYSGRIEVDATLRVKEFNGMYAAGDAAALKDKDGSLLRRSVNFSVYSGAVAGRNAAAYLLGHREKVYKPVDLGWVIPVHGESSGMLFGTVPVSGETGLRLHYLMCGFRNFTLKNGLYYLEKSIRLFQ